LANSDSSETNTQIERFLHTSSNILDTEYSILYTINMRFFAQSATLLLASSLVLIIISTPLSGYMVPILGFIIAFSVILIVIRQRTRSRLPADRQGEELFVGSNKEVFTITLALLLAIFLTGGINSNLFFLLYFILFGIVFLFEPATVFVLVVGFGLVFFQSLGEGDLIGNLVKLGSLAFLSPICYFFGREFQKTRKLSEEVEDKTGQIIEDAETLKSHMRNQDEIEEIEDIEDQAEELRKESEENE